MKQVREKIIGITGAILVYGAAFLVLQYSFLRVKTPAKHSGVVINFGAADLADGFSTPENTEDGMTAGETSPTPSAWEMPQLPQLQAPESSVETQSQTSPEPPPVTRNIETAAAVETADPAQTRMKQEQRRLEAIARQISGAFAEQTGAGRQRKGQTGAGWQEYPQNTPATAAGNSKLDEFDLGGRRLEGMEGLPRPAYSAQEEGTIVVDIVVDTGGKVIRAEIGKGTNIASATMRRSALEAARKARFNSINGNNNQMGTITYRYSLK